MVNLTFGCVLNLSVNGNDLNLAYLVFDCDSVSLFCWSSTSDMVLDRLIHFCFTSFIYSVGMFL